VAVSAMEKFTVHTGIVVPLDRGNVDTDQIIPKQFLKSIKKTGYGPNLFDAWRGPCPARRDPCSARRRTGSGHSPSS